MREIRKAAGGREGGRDTGGGGLGEGGGGDVNRKIGKEEGRRGGEEK